MQFNVLAVKGMIGIRREKKMPTNTHFSENTLEGGGFLIINANHKQAEENLHKNIRKLTKKTFQRAKQPLKRPKRSYSAFSSIKAQIFDYLGVDSVLPIEERKVYNLVGEIGSKDAHFEEVKE